MKVASRLLWNLSVQRNRSESRVAVEVRVPLDRVGKNAHKEPCESALECYGTKRTCTVSGRGTPAVTL